MLEILYQDAYLVVINKPSGLLVHKSPIDKKETEFALQLVRDQIGQWVYPVHRLDKPTSGVLVFALSSEVANLLSEQFREHSIQKEYLAVVRGYTKEEELIDYDLKVILDKKADKDRSKNKEPQEAQTEYERLKIAELPYAVSRYPVARYSLLKLLPRTGRKHQLRRHMKHILHPIVGDTKYGRNEHNNLFREKFDCHRLLLHASKLEFLHPVSKENMCVEAGLDDVFKRVLEIF
ncbi:MAG: tRNA pseudouridine synthase C (EC [uncultured Sulfurovum sp.]|uniref:tRNA pseudouridine synthase C n=1 Tax=uncultured Sulfurovum sp. TaxID=269237 RepID=A0A6S6TJ90_9BACT|nr:MAG: tRNA pseudouridine synthase C (EC [uncultured Sulfurovum sp.]